MHLLDLPNDILHGAILGCLSVKDIALFGVAVTNKEFRPNYLRNVLPTVHLSPRECHGATYESMKWMMQRNMRISDVLITDETKECLTEEVALHCSTLESLHCHQSDISIQQHLLL